MLLLFCFIELLVFIFLAIKFRKDIKQRKAKELFLSIFIVFLTAEILDLVFNIFLKHIPVPLINSVWIATGLIYANFDYIFIKRRFKGNIIHNSFFIPSFVFFIIIAIIVSLVIFLFFSLDNAKILRGQILRFIFNFLFGYSVILYWKFLKVERVIGPMFFENKFIQFPTSQNKKKSEKAEMKDVDS